MIIEARDTITFSTPAGALRALLSRLQDFEHRHGLESSEFKRQNALLAQRWKLVLSRDVPMPGRDHFTVIDGLADRANPLFAATRRMMGLDQ